MPSAALGSPRALWFAGKRRAELRPEEAPTPGPGEVRIRAVLSAVSHGTEMLVYRGGVPEDLPLDLPTFAGGFGFPIKHGYASAGRVLDAGPGVTALAPGDPVFVHHPHQDVFTVPADLPVPLPRDLDPLRAVFFANMETALNVVHDAHARLGETAVVFGQGVVGLLVTRLLTMSGVSVLAVEPVPVGPAAPDPLDHGVGVDEGAVHVEQEGAGGEHGGGRHRQQLQDRGNRAAPPAGQGKRTGATLFLHGTKQFRHPASAPAKTSSAVQSGSAGRRLTRPPPPTGSTRPAPA